MPKSKSVYMVRALSFFILQICHVKLFTTFAEIFQEYKSNKNNYE